VGGPLGSDVTSHAKAGIRIALVEACSAVHTGLRHTFIHIGLTRNATLQCAMSARRTNVNKIKQQEGVRGNATPETWRAITDKVCVRLATGSSIAARK
jgi:hypothetical protein